jgi:hypothetical protein
VTVAMSERDFATLLDAASWVQLHSGVDAPAYSGLNQLSWVVDAIGRRRPVPEPVRPREPRARCSDLVSALFDLRDRQESEPRS